ncbi:MAG: SGNH/GDSL hydrolase family protein [Acidimicrobiales bacterium]
MQEPKVDLRNPAPSGLTDAPVKDGEVPAAVAGDAWWSTAEFQEAQSYTVKPGGVWHYENPYRALDFRSKYINVIDGLRKSWRPPACDCRRLKVWVYGGSTAWGIGQRDDHTIPSELARVAHEHGMTIDVDNRGLPGDHHWIEAERLAYDLTIEPPPDLVVFYDGVNDRWWERGLHDRIFDEIWIQSGRSQGRPPRGRTGSRIMPPPTLDSQGLQLTAEGVRRWDLARKMSKATSKATGVPVRYIWQPERYSRPFEPTEPHFDTRHENDARKASQFAEENLAPDVIDLTRALDRTKGPIYTDDAHHNERGARVIAEAMFAALQDDLRAIEAKA